MPMFHQHLLGHVVRQLRDMAEAGCAPNAILEYLRARCGENERLQYAYLEAAFFPQIPAAPFTFVVPPFGSLAPAAEGSVSKLISQHRAVWSAQRFPELMRIRDYFAFLEFSRDQQVILTVCTANPFSGRYIGQPGFRPYAGTLFVVSNDTDPDRGLVSADPNDARLINALARYAPALSYEEYVMRLEQLGYRVRPPGERYLVEDAGGHALFEGYRLHGAYDVDSGSPAWTAKRGERLRAALNRRLGGELVHFGPHDQWQHRNDLAIAGPLSGPRLPAIAFHPDGEIDPILTIRDMGWGITQIEQHWKRLYPNHPADT
jgi:hypothetical protein